VNELSPRAQRIIEDIQKIRVNDAPTHGGRVLSYVYDSGIAELDELAAAAAREVQAVNGLDPTTFPSIAVMERDLLGFTRAALNGGDDVFGNVTTGGTESCLLAIKTARDVWRAKNKQFGRHAVGRIVAPSTVHAAIHKAAAYFDLTLDLVPVDPTTGAVSAEAVINRLGSDVAVVVLSAPNYPYAQLDPIEKVARVTLERDIALHVDACIGGFALPWWQGVAQPWDFSVPGVTSISADLHKYGYAPKGISILLQRGVQRHRAQYFSIVGWPGYPVVNPTLLGSKSAGPIASAWAITSYLGKEGFAELVARTQRATQELIDGMSQVVGLRVQGDPTGPLFAIVCDEAVRPSERVDPHLLVDELRTRGWFFQSQPGCFQADGSSLPHSAHLTITPVIADQTEDLLDAVRQSANIVRGRSSAGQSELVHKAAAAVMGVLAQHGVGADGSGVDDVPSQVIHQLLAVLGFDPGVGDLPTDMSSLLATAQRIPSPIAQRLLTEVLALVVQPAPDPF
jgi:glutamate/tyrosine decarboxylase-like PLP-dependent enzyme